MSPRIRAFGPGALLLVSLAGALVACEVTNGPGGGCAQLRCEANGNCINPQPALPLCSTSSGGTAPVGQAGAVNGSGGGAVTPSGGAGSGASGTGNTGTAGGQAAGGGGGFPAGGGAATGGGAPIGGSANVGGDSSGGESGMIGGDGGDGGAGGERAPLLR